MSLKFSIFLATLCLFSCTTQTTPALVAPVETNPLETTIVALADTFLLDSMVHSVSIGVFYNGQKSTFHFGELDPGKGNTPTDQTIYEIASVSKTLTGTLVAKAVLEGKIKLDDDIRIYLNGDFPNFEYKGSPITIKHLVTHTSGLPKFLPESVNELFNNFDETLPARINNIMKTYTKSAFFEDLRNFKLNETPGSSYSYSNVDTEIIAHILENVYKKPFDLLIQDYFGKTAQMPNTKIHLTANEMNGLANGYGVNGSLVPHEVIPLYGADGGIKSTLPDLVNYMEFQLNETNKVATESHKSLFADDFGSVSYYWPLKEDEEYGKYFRHHGGAFGTQNWFFIFPKYNLGISVVTNQSDQETPEKLISIVNGLIDEVIKLQK